MKKSIRTLVFVITAVVVLAFASLPAFALNQNLTIAAADEEFNDLYQKSIEQYKQAAENIQEDFNNPQDIENSIEDYQESSENISNFIKEHQEYSAKKMQENASEAAQFEKEFEETEKLVDKMQKTSHTIFWIIFSVALVFMIAEIVCILVMAPKCGMSRLWALVPVFSNIFGLIVFIIVFTNRKNSSNAVNGKTFVCPTCNAVHPIGTTECSICGEKFE